jgi:hypothetical protein
MDDVCEYEMGGVSLVISVVEAVGRLCSHLPMGC